MKFIGEFIQDFIARFRNDVFLEDVDTGTIVSGGNLGLDSHNKIVKNTVSGGGDFTLTADSGSSQTISAGNTLDVAGGNAISTVVGATDTVTINHDDTSDQASVNNSGSTVIQDITLDTYGHVTGLTSKEIGKEDIGLTNVEDKNSATIRGEITASDIPNLNTSKLTAGTLGVARGGTGITNFSNSTHKNSNTTKSDVGLGNVDNVSEATLTSNILTAVAKSDVGLADVENKSSADIRAEIVEGDIPNLGASKITSGTFGDARIPNIAASKVTSGSFVDARIPNLAASKITSGTFNAARIPTLYAYQYINFLGNAAVAASGAWKGTSANGHSNHQWNKNLTAPDSPLSGSASTLTKGEYVKINKNEANSGIRIPYSGILVGFTAISKNTTNNVYYGGLLHAPIGANHLDIGANTNVNAELVAVGTANNDGGSYHGGRVAVVEDLSNNKTVNAGEALYPCIRGDGSTSSTVQMSMTIVIKTPITS